MTVLSKAFLIVAGARFAEGRYVSFVILLGVSFIVEEW